MQCGYWVIALQTVRRWFVVDGHDNTTQRSDGTIGPINNAESVVHIEDALWCGHVFSTVGCICSTDKE